MLDNSLILLAKKMQMQTKENILQKLTAKVAEFFEQQHADHDFYHIQRVVKLAQEIQKQEGGDFFVITCAALLHDISDHKLNGGIMNDNGRVSRLYLEELNCEPEWINQICDIVDKVSFKGSGVADEAGSLELKIVRDADRLDAIGAIGIARAFHFGGARNRPFFVPDVAPNDHTTFEAYAQDKSHTINHFYEKLLLLKDRMETQTAKQIAVKRHHLMQEFVDQFHAEWEGLLNLNYNNLV